MGCLHAACQDAGARTTAGTYQDGAQQHAASRAAAATNTTSDNHSQKPKAEWCIDFKMFTMYTCPLKIRMISSLATSTISIVVEHPHALCSCFNTRLNQQKHAFKQDYEWLTGRSQTNAGCLFQTLRSSSAALELRSAVAMSECWLPAWQRCLHLPLPAPQAQLPRYLQACRGRTAGTAAGMSQEFACQKLAMACWC